MSRRTSPRRGVLLQVRNHVEARDHERLCFLETCGLGPEELACADLVREPRLDWSEVAFGDFFLIGGSGEYSVTRDYPFTPALAEIVLRAVGEGRPVFGSCWGHHFLGRVLGGEVITDESRSELGTFDVELTPEGAADPLFAGFPSHLAVNLGHHDRVSVLAPGMRQLAFSELCPNQVLRLEGKPVYGTQFHSEMNEAHMRARLLMYQQDYLPQGLTVEDFERRLRPTPLVAGLLRRFVDLYT